jgi:hypothetical protein
VRRRHHAGGEHDQTGIVALGDQRRNIASEGLSNEQDVRAAAYRVDDDLRVLAHQRDDQDGRLGSNRTPTYS